MTRKIAILLAVVAIMVTAFAGVAVDRTINGTAGADQRVGTAEDDVLRGFGGNDTVNGRGDKDTVFGSIGKM